MTKAIPSIILLLSIISCNETLCSEKDVENSIYNIDLYDTLISRRKLDSIANLSCISCRSYELIANYYLQLNQNSNAIAYSRKLFGICDSFDVRSYSVLSEAFKRNGETDSSLFYFNLFRKHDNSDMVFNSYYEGLIYYEGARFVEALEAFQNSIDQNELHKSKVVDETVIHEYICLCLDKLGRNEESCEHARRFVPRFAQICDSLDIN